jgi:flavin reductase (DIM6/NTAB) family NADH-FMN oxidoreductase RutF
MGVNLLVPLGVRRRLAALRRRLVGRPESTFIRVAYTTPRQVVLITTRHAGADNVWPLDFHMPLSFEPPLYSIAAMRPGYGTALIRQSGIFVVNFVPAAWEKTIFLCGNISGRTTDKFAAAGLRKEEAESVDAPRLADSLGALECRVRQTLEVGDHTLFIGEVTRTIYRADAPRLHHLDLRMRDTAETIESATPADAASGAGRRRTLDF